jgi:regulatory protein
MSQSLKKNLSPDIVLQKLKNYCARQERSHSQIREKLYQYNLKPAERENIVATLITNGFLNEERFAKAFAGGKFRIKKWGKRKITMHLQQKNISDYSIKAGLKEISDKEYFDTLLKLAQKKLNTSSEKSKLIVRNKVYKYLLGKGYEPQLIEKAFDIIFE